MRTTTDLYKLLGVPREATQDDIRKAHRKLVRKYHPDSNPGDHSSGENFREVQRAYEVLSDPKKRREYDKRLGTSTGRSSGQPRPRAGRKTGGEGTAPPVDLSEILRKLTERSSGHKAGSSQLRGEEVARLANVLGMDMSRISELLGKDITRLSKLVGESINMNAKANLGAARSDRYRPTGERVSSGKRSGGSNASREKKVKGPKAQRKEKRVRGPKARKRRRDR